MDKSVGESFKITEDRGIKGFLLDFKDGAGFRYEFPCFVLEEMKKRKLKYKPDFPDSFKVAKKMINNMIKEYNEVNITYCRGFKSGLRFGLTVIKDLERNLKKGSEK